jgi:hypothetical protein
VCATITVCAYGEPTCERVTHSELIELRGSFDSGVTHLRRDELKNLFEIHAAHLTTRDLGK